MDARIAREVISQVEEIALNLEDEMGEIYLLDEDEEEAMPV